MIYPTNIHVFQRKILDQVMHVCLLFILSYLSSCIGACHPPALRSHARAPSVIVVYIPCSASKLRPCRLLCIVTLSFTIQASLLTIVSLTFSFRYRFGMHIIHSNHKLWKIETDLSSLDVLSSLLYSCTQTVFFFFLCMEMKLNCMTI